MTIVSDPRLLPGGETIEREIEGVGTLRFENYGPGQWLTAQGDPAKNSRRRYLLDGDELDGVSSIVGALDKPALRFWIEDQATRGAVQAERLGELDDVPEEDWAKRVKSLGLGASAKRDEGADRGTAIHAAFHTLACDGRAPDPASFSAITRPWVQGAMRAWLAMAPEPVASEEIVCNQVHLYAGRPDLLAKVDGALTLVDYKTGKGRVFDSAHYQARLYAMALASMGVEIERIILLGIADDGGFQLVDCAASEADAEALIAVYRSRRRINADMAAQRRIAKAAAGA